MSRLFPPYFALVLLVLLDLVLVYRYNCTSTSYIHRISLIYQPDTLRSDYKSSTHHMKCGLYAG